MCDAIASLLKDREACSSCAHATNGSACIVHCACTNEILAYACANAEEADKCVQHEIYAVDTKITTIVEDLTDFWTIVGAFLLIIVIGIGLWRMLRIFIGVNDERGALTWSRPESR